MSDPETPLEPSTSPRIPVEIEIYLNPDGSVTFADLEEQAVAIARELDPDCQLACDVPPSHQDDPTGSTSWKQVSA